MKYPRGLIAALTLVAYSLPVSAQTHEAHVHGEASMEIHTEDHHVVVRITLPGMDFVGFEHEPATESEKEAVHDRMEAIEMDPGSIAKIRAGGFTRLNPDHVHVGEAGHDEHHDDERHDDEHHDEEHHDDEHHEGEEHNEYMIELEFEVDEGTGIRSLDLEGFFEEFPTVESISWIRLSDSGQSAGEATPRSDRIPLRD